MWCTEDGKLPSPPPNQGGAPVDILTNVTVEVEKAPSTEETELQATPMSPNKIYTIGIAVDSVNSTCPSQLDSCVHEYRFVWLRRESCEAKFQCSRLEGNVCGDFAPQFQVEGGESSGDVCYARTQHTAQMDENDLATVKFWRVSGTTMNAQCILWCTQNGKIPETTSKGDFVDPNIVDKIVSEANYHITVVRIQQSFINCSLQFNKTKCSDQVTLRPETELDRPGSINVSPIKYYHINGSSDSHKCDSGSKCNLSFEFNLISPETDDVCHFTILCNKLSGHSCANYALQLEGQDICRKGVKHKATLRALETTTVSLWFDSEAVFDYSCLAWCTPDDELPNREKSNVLDKETTKDLISKVRGVDDVFDDPSTLTDGQVVNHVLASSKIYRFSAKNASAVLSESSGKVASIRHSFYWRGQDNFCKSNFLCSKLSGNPCGDYGIEVSDSLGSKDVCLVGDLYKGQVERGEAFTIKIWASDENDVDFNCFLYCTENGELPDLDPESVVDLEFVAELLDSTGIVRQVEIKTNVEHVYRAISDLNIYHVTAEENCDKNADESGCVRKALFGMYFEDSCEFGMVCPSLVGHPCGDYKLELSLQGENDAKEICHERSQIQGVYLYESDVSVSLWQSNTAANVEFR